MDSSCDFNHTESDWLGLPMELLSVVADKIVECKDYTRFGAVCQSWQTIYTENKNHKIREPLLLLLPTEGEIRSLYSLSEKRFYDNFNLRVPHDRVCRGSSFGWLALISNDFEVSLVNPLLSHDNEIWLPKFQDLDEVIHLNKVILSADPMLNRNFVVVAIHGHRSTVSFYKPGDKSWTPLDSQVFPICDIAYYEDKIYALRQQGDLFAFDVNGPSPVVTTVARRRDSHPFGENYLVKSSAGWLQIVRHMEFKEGTTYCITSGFTVLKLDMEAVKWCKIESLGDEILFLGDNSSVCLSVSDMPGCKPNCIYFTDDQHEYYFYEVDFGPHDMGVFNLEDSSIERLCPIDSKLIIPAPIFFQSALTFMNT